MEGYVVSKRLQDAVPESSPGSQQVHDPTEPLKSQYSSVKNSLAFSLSVSFCLTRTPGLREFLLQIPLKMRCVERMLLSELAYHARARWNAVH
ncbi:hypothetical protein CSB45_13220 [candidate division KSB3 bacterium]|uniref:Uncharacterized protein n=1 Tax=candidate division KSB3 bacterium TaxID=2044937 RepID=A0A2G6E1V8_9BACT|nr:MAG: hypothetical protein CSB45_13220 [candidate division KSB3 bacterium]PIE28658.1 MAG: hypothetical protein CSA57_12875 [candidate division KSB3 bacterium]